ncbi:MAG TPA: adenylate/guanylate cyclase domain-containing protein [Patescibacteria group bacterium]
MHLLPSIDTKAVSRKVVRGFLIGLGIFVLLNTAYSLGLFSSWQARLSDSLFVAKQSNPNIVIIAIDDKSIAKIGKFPWNRSVYADLLNKMSEGNTKPASIGLDVSFLEKGSESEDSALASSIHKLGNVTISAEVNPDSAVLTPVETLSKEANVGIANTSADSFGVTRFAKLQLVSTQNKHYDGFAYAVARTYLGNKSLPTTYLDNLPLSTQSVRINYIGGPGSYITYSFSDVLDGEVNPRVFRDKIVLIGATAPDLHDNQLTPTSGSDFMSGVEIQANTIQTLLDQRFLVEESKLATIFTIFIISALASSLFVLLPLIPLTFAFVALGGGFIAYVIYSFDHGVIRNIIYPSLAIFLIGITNIVYKYFSEIRKKQFVRKAFSYYLSESVMSEVLSNPSKLKLGGERRPLTVLFSDVAGFTTISEKIPPETLLALLNHYLTVMTNIIFKYRGVLDKYMGDGVMAFWGAPIKEADHALLACMAALEMYDKVGEIRSNWVKKGVSFDIRIGVNSGDMIVGNMGSHQRFNYSLVGDGVNLGARLESINKEYGTHIIISESTYNLVKEKVIARKLDIVAVKGKEKGIAIYELIGVKTGTFDETFLKEFEEARKEYEDGKFLEALGKFKILSKKYPSDSPTGIYLARLRILSKARPRNWTGVYHSQTK